MRVSIAVLIGATLFAGLAFPQQEEASKVDLYGEYSYLRFNPAFPGVPSRNFNGGGGGGTFFLGKYFGVKGDLIGYASNTWTATFPSQVVATPHGTSETIPAGTFSSNANMFTYLFGPVVRMPWKSVTVFGETLFGGANSNGYANLERAINAGGGTVNVSASQNCFSMAVGGGFDVNVSKNFAIRAGEFDYLLTRYSNPITSTNNQNNFRYLAGVVFRFH